MLSILIPEYNCDCTRLVSELGAQCRDLGIEYELLVMDDFSQQCLDENRRMNALPFVRFIENTINQKAARVRNQLAEIARYNRLLFLDCDLQMVDNQFVKRYVDAFPLAGVLVGSVVYQDVVPPVQYRLRWKYGRVRESKPASVRNLNPWNAFASANFCIEKDAFMKILFDESFQDYGHEDTLFGLQLKEKQINVLHLDNPLYHQGLDENQRFLEKSLTAVSKYCTCPAFSNPEMAEEVRIFRVFNRCKALRADGWLAFVFKRTRRLLRKQLCGPYPVLVLFDFYRLGYLCALTRQNTLHTD